jgi:hypothetical protein
MSTNDYKTLSEIKTCLESVSADIRSSACALATSTTRKEIITNFNQSAIDFFNLLHQTSKDIGKEKICDVPQYLYIFEKAKNKNPDLPAEKFTLTLLKFSHHIFNREEEKVLGMSIKNQQVGDDDNGFAVINSEMFKTLWKSLVPYQKDAILDKLYLVTFYALCFFYNQYVSMSK